MSNVKFVPFGRGSTCSTSHINEAFTTLRTLSMDVDDGGLHPSNFSPQAGIPEELIDFGPHYNTPGHTHGKSALAKSSISSAQINTSSGHEYQLPLAYAHSSGHLMLAGVSKTFNARHTKLISDWVPFSDTSIQRLVFPYDTEPAVIVAPFLDDDEFGIAAEFPVRVVVKSVSHDGFSFVAGVYGDAMFIADDIRIQVMYIAIGQAPGYLAAPAVMMDEG
jgi:hypothetical protein